MAHSDPVAAQTYNREYKRANRWRYRARQKSYDAAKHANLRAESFRVVGTITAEDVESILAAGRCYHCGSIEDRLELDHLVPMDKGGPNLVTNIVAACGACNKSKWQAPAPWRWSRAHDACLGCGTTERKHAAQGFCNACYLERFGAKAKRRAAAERAGVSTPGH